MQVNLRIFAELISATAAFLAFGILNLFAIDLGWSDAIIFVGISPLIPLVLIGFRCGFKMCFLAALIASSALYFFTSGITYELNVFIDIVISSLAASLATLMATYAKPRLHMVLISCLAAEFLRFAVVLAYAVYSKAGSALGFGLSELAASNGIYFIFDLTGLIVISTGLFLASSGRLYEYKL